MKKRKKNRKIKVSKEPFIIHADPLKERTAFPTHTHGLTNVGMPEFVMDPIAFGPYGNGNRINAAYKFFKKPKNADKLAAILNGETVKLTGKELSSKHMKDDPCIYCFREVTFEFEAVKQAYVIPGTVMEPGMRFIQIWVEGDDFALMDEYYRGGVKW
jgi:hypothetical protein